MPVGRRECSRSRPRHAGGWVVSPSASPLVVERSTGTSTPTIARHDEGLLDRNPAANVRRPKVDYESRTLGLDRRELGALLVQAGRRRMCAADGRERSVVVQRVSVVEF